MLIVCGSAVSWVSDKLLGSKGGLYDRTTSEIKLQPFSLGECEAFFASRGVVLDKYDILQAYMVFGGIPYYLNLFSKGDSLAQNIDRLVFARKGKLYDEFDRLFSSMFTNAEEAKKVVRLLAGKRIGYTREEILQKTKYPTMLTLITTFGLKHNEYSGRIQSVVTSDDLFKLL